jgi:hypothetical protein
MEFYVKRDYVEFYIHCIHTSKMLIKYLALYNLQCKSTAIAYRFLYFIKRIYYLFAYFFSRTYNEQNNFYILLNVLGELCII